MEKYDFTNYYHLLKSFDYEQDAYNPYDEFYQEYIKILDDFNPVLEPPEIDKKEYIKQYILPILRKYCIDFQCSFEYEEIPDGILANIISKSIVIISEDTDLKSIVDYAASISIRAASDKVILSFYFSTK